MVFVESDKHENDIGIYVIKNKINNKVYVGQTKERFLRRYWHHRWKLVNNQHDNQHLQNAWNKYGRNNFCFEVIHSICSDIDDASLDDLESNYILKYKKLNLCYNILIYSGTRRGIPMKESTKKIIGEKNKINMTGRKASDATKKKMSNTRKGKRNKMKSNVLTPEMVVDIKKDLINGFSSIETAKRNNANYGAVNGVYSYNTWSSVHVDGWDDFYKNRKRGHRLSRDDYVEIKALYVSGTSIEELMILYDKCKATIDRAIKLAQ